MAGYHKESKHWVANFFLNSLLRAKWKPPYNAYLYNYFRRAEAAFLEHDVARTATLDFVTSGRQSPSRHALAIFHWEVFLGQSWHAFKLLEKAFGFVLYTPGTASVEERLNHLYNQMKHVESRIVAGQMLPCATVPVWMRNEGLVSVDANLTWAETGEVLRRWRNGPTCVLTHSPLLRSFANSMPNIRINTDPWPVGSACRHGPVMCDIGRQHFHVIYFSLLRVAGNDPRQQELL